MSCLNPNIPIYKEILRITESPAQTEIILKYKSSDDEYGMIPFSVAEPIYKYYNLVSEDNKPKKLSFKDATDWVKKTKDSLYFNFKVSKTETKDYQILLYLKPEEEDLYLKPGEGIQGNLFFSKSSNTGFVPQNVKDIEERLMQDLPIEVAKAITVLAQVPRAILGRTDLFLSLKEILNDNGITDEILINWAGVNQAKIGNIKTFKSEEQLTAAIQKLYDKKKEVNNHPELKSNPLALKSFKEWVKALENYPIAFQDIMLTHAIKYLNPQRRAKYVLQLSEVALTNTHGILVNKPHEANRLGKLYDQEVIATVSDAVGHEPSASGKGYWVHIPRTSKPVQEKSYIIRTTTNGFEIDLYIEQGNVRAAEGIKEFKTRAEAQNFVKEQNEKENNDSNSAQFKVNVELLRKLSPSTWCTASGMAPYYVENHDNYLLIVNGVTVAGIEAYPNTHEEDEEIDALFYDTEELERRKIQQTNGKIKVKEVTSRGNNGISSIDHYDDILAFFEKHNLDTNNNSLQRAKNAKDLGKKDSEVFENEDEDGYFNPYGEGYDADGYFNDPHDGDDFRRNEAARLLTTVEEALTLIDIDGFILQYFSEMPQNIKDNEEIANKAIDYNAHNITQISITLPFYDELAIRAVNRNPPIFNYLNDEKKNLPGLQELYDQYEKEVDDLPFSKTNENLIQGYYDANNDKVVVIANNTPLDEASKVGIHEVAHRGMLRMAKELGGISELGKALFSAEDQLMKKLPELLKRTGHTSLENLMLDYGFTTESEEGKIKLLMELTARWAETLIDKPKPSWWIQLLGKISDWITKFTGKTLSESEVDELVGGFVNYGTQDINNLSDVSAEVENKSELETFLEEIEQYPTEELSPIVGEYYDILSRHLNDLVNNKNYTKLKELFTEDKVDKVEKIQDIVRRANKLKDTISKQKQQALALAKTVIQLDYLIDKVEVKIEDIIKNEQDALLNLEELQRYLDMINNWNQLLEIAKEKFPKTKVESKIVLTQNKIKRIKKNIILNDKSGIVSMLKEVLGDYSMKYNKNAQEELQKLKTLLERKIENKRSPEDIEKARKKVEQKQQEIDALDFEVGDNILDFLEGRRGDVSSFFSAIRAYRDSSNPTIFGFASYMRDLLDDNINKAYNWGIAYERELDLTQSDRLDPSIMGKAITFVDKSGTLMLLNKWKDYKFDFNLLKDVEKATLANFNSSNTTENEEIYLKAKKARIQFEKDYMYREFTDAYYEKFELFEDPIGQSLKEDIDIIFDQIKDIDSKIADFQPTPEELDRKAGLLRDYNQLGSIYAKNKKKEGDALLKAQRMRQYRKINSKIYDYIPDYNLFEEAKEKFKDYLVTDLGLSETSPEYAQELLKWTEANTRTVISQKYYEDVENLMLKLKVLFDRSQNKEIKEDIVKQWEIIKDAIYANKDEDNQPIGSIIDPLPSEKIKSAQETIESLIQLGRELGNLTPNQLQRLKELEDLQEVSELSEEEEIELRELNSLHSMSSASDRARLKVLLQELSELQSKVPTTYYIDEFNSLSAPLGTIIDDNGNVDWNAFSEEENIPQGVSILNSPKLDELLEDPEFNDWFNKNHIKVKKFNKETFEYEIVWQRTFQWSVNKPNDAKYYEILPSQAYTNREVKPEFKTGYNKNTQKVELVVGEHITNLSNYDFLPDPNKPKSADYANQKYYDLKNAKDSTSKRYFKNLEIHTERALQAQEDAMYTAKIWLAIPAALKTSQENLVGSIKSVKNPSTIAKNVKNRVKSIKEGINNFSEDPDINFKSPLEKEEEEKNKRYKNSYSQDFFKIPIKFTEAKEADLVSLDLQRSYSLYNESVSRNKLLLEKLPIAKSLKRLLEDTNEDNTKDSVKNTLTAVLDIIMRDFEGSTSYRDIAGSKAAITAIKTSKKIAGIALIKYNIQAAAKNLTSASAQNWIFSNNNLFSSKAYATSKYTYNVKFIPGIIADKLGNRLGKRSLSSQMFVLWQPLMGMTIEDFIGDKAGNSTGINIAPHWNLIQVGREITEGLVQTRPWIAALLSTYVERTLPDGSKDLITLYDAYELDADGFITVKEGVDKQWLSGGKLFNKKKNEIQQFIRNRQGNYDPRDKTKAETSFFTSIPFFLKKYYVPLMESTWGANLSSDAHWTDYLKLKGGDTLGGEPRGFLYQTIQVGHFVIKEGLQNWDTLTTQDKQALQKTAKYILALTILHLIVGSLLGYSGDDKNKKKELSKYSWWEFQLLILLIGTEKEISTPTSMLSMYNNISNITLFSGLKKWIDVYEAAIPTLDLKEKSLKMDTYKSNTKNVRGKIIHKKGDLKATNALKIAIGWGGLENYYDNPDQMLKNMSSAR